MLSSEQEPGKKVLFPPVKRGRKARAQGLHGAAMRIYMGNENPVYWQTLQLGC